MAAVTTSPDKLGEAGGDVETAAIEVSDLVYTYAGASQPAVRNLAFSVQRGEIFGFLGPSGAGKSTTQRILIRLLDGYRGEVRVLGRELSGWGQDYYEHVGVAFEFPNHFLKLTALENLSYFRSLYSGKTEDPRSLLHAVGLGDSADMPVSQFSKGMKTRLSVARAIIHNPELLFLDEPTGGLDPVNSQLVRDLVLEQRSMGRTVFLTTHDMSIADELCDRVAFIMDGRISLIDAPRKLKLRYGESAVRVEFGEYREYGNNREYGDDGEYGAGKNRRSREFGLAGLGDSQEFLDLLRTEKVQTSHTQEATLEQIFIRVTGRELVGSDADGR